MIEPMLAVPLEKVAIANYADWAIEIKFDGIRLVVEKQAACVRAWTRPRKHAGDDKKTMASFALPDHLIEAFGKMPDGLYDGELLAGLTSTDVKRKDLRGRLVFVVFDVMRFLARDTVKMTYDARRELLDGLFRECAIPEVITLAESFRPESKEDVARFTQRIWDAGGEGAMLKRRAAVYQPGKRSKDVVKLKKLQTEVMVVTGFERSKGEKIDRGPFAIVRLKSIDGKRETTVKTLDDAELAAFHREDPYKGSYPASGVITTAHPAIGRLLRIEFQDWAKNGGYRHPRWDRWENE